MSQIVTNKRLAKNLVMSLSAQLISIITSFVLGFIVPKFIDELQYSYWQMYVLYVGYTGVLHFGLLDGLVLRYSKYDYDELDKPRIRSQFQLMLAFHSLLAFISCLVAAFAFSGVTTEIIVLVAVGLITKNVFTYTSYSFQITNRINKYAVLVIVQRAAYAIFVVVLLLAGVNDFYWYCIADLFGDIAGILLGAIFNRGMYFGKGIGLKGCFKECWPNVSSGIMLMIANFSSSFIVGGAKMMIQWRWDELVFGQVAFSFSVSNLFLTFVTAISVVLFPSLKRMDESDLPNVYMKIRNAISPLLFFAMILFFPGCQILGLWLPSYTDSLVYLGILLPLIIFSSKVSLLTNNYLKAYRKEKLMLLINVCSIVVGMALFAIGAYALNNLDFVLYSVVFIVLANSIASEIAVMKLIKKNITFDFIVELAMTVVFVAVVRFLDRWWGCLAYAAALVVYSVIYRKSLATMLGNLKRVLLKIFRRRKPSAPIVISAPAPSVSQASAPDVISVTSPAPTHSAADNAPARHDEGGYSGKYSSVRYAGRYARRRYTGNFSRLHK